MQARPDIDASAEAARTKVARLREEDRIALQKQEDERDLEKEKARVQEERGAKVSEEDKAMASAKASQKRAGGDDDCNKGNEGGVDTDGESISKTPRKGKRASKSTSEPKGEAKEAEARRLVDWLKTDGAGEGREAFTKDNALIGIIYNDLVYYDEPASVS